MPDNWEVEKGLDANAAADGATDPDGDGCSNLEDYNNWLGRGSTPVAPAVQ